MDNHRRKIMLRNKGAWLALALLVLPILAACGPEPAAAPTPTNTSAPAATATTADVATATTAPAASPTTAGTPAANTPAPQPTVAMVSATDTNYSIAECGYGGLMKGIEAVNPTTVKFTLCGPDPAFRSKIAFSSVGIQSAKHLQATGGK